MDAPDHAALLLHLARTTLAAARHDPPHDPPPGEHRVPAAVALPAAGLLLEDTPDPDDLAAALVPALEDLSSGDPRAFPSVIDGHGHTRPLYAPLTLHLLLNTFATHGHRLHEGDRTLCEASAARACQPLSIIRRRGQAMKETEFAAAIGKPLPPPDQETTGEPAPDDFALTLWLAALYRTHAWLTGVDPDPADRLVEYIAAFNADDSQSNTPLTPLAPLAPGEALDGWTYRELAALHALDLLTRHGSDSEHPQWPACRERVAAYHAAHTQPDYTTYQPWGLPAFLRSPATVTMAEQQMHDLTSHLAIEGPAAGVIPALLLADAAWGVA